MRTLIAAGLAAFALPVSAQAATIINGSFEQGVNPGSFTTLENGSTAITGWVVGGLGIDYIGSYWEADDGDRSIDLSGNDKGSISQLLTDLVVGQEYTVNFSLAGNPDGGGSTKVAAVSDGGSQSSVYFFDQAGGTRDNMGWTRQAFSFIATDTSANLTFSATENNAFGPAIDNVSLLGSGVPEPATWALMILGMGAVGGAMRRRKSVLATA